MTGKHIVPGQGAISKNPPNEFTIDELAKWLARMNPEFGISEDRRSFKWLITDALNSGDLTIRGNPQFQMPGRCPDCHGNWQSPMTIPITDIERWCTNRGFVFGGSGTRKTQEIFDRPESPIHENSKKKYQQLIVAFYNFCSDLVHENTNNRAAKKLIKQKTDQITPHGLGDYLRDHHDAPPSAGKIIAEAIKLKNI